MVLQRGSPLQLGPRVEMTGNTQDDVTTPDEELAMPPLPEPPPPPEPQTSP